MMSHLKNLAEIILLNHQHLSIETSVKEDRKNIFVNMLHENKPLPEQAIFWIPEKAGKLKNIEQFQITHNRPFHQRVVLW